MTHQHFNDENHEQFMRKVDYLDNHLRQLTLPPEDLFARIPLKKHDTVLDLGAGTGYLTLPAAAYVKETVYALDLSAKMLELIATRAKAANLTNIECLNSSIEALPLEAESVNQVFASLVLHELPDLETALTQIHRVLKTEGHFTILELAEHDHHGAPRLTPSALRNALELTGFTITKEEHPESDLYIIIAQK